VLGEEEWISESEQGQDRCHQMGAGLRGYANDLSAM
jgi:hypothetical protein